jgi:hypothetical protein
MSSRPGRRLYNSSLLISVLGLLLALAGAALILCGPRLAGWNERLSEYALYRDLPILDSIKPLVWRKSARAGMVRDYFVPTILVQALFIAVHLAFRQRLLSLADRLATYRDSLPPPDRHAMRVLIACGFMALAVAQLRLYIGFYSHGVVGWTFGMNRPLISGLTEEQAVATERELLARHPFLRDAVDSGFPLRYPVFQEGEQITNSEVFFLRFDSPRGVVRLGDAGFRRFWTYERQPFSLAHTNPPVFFRFVRDDLSRHSRGLLSLPLGWNLMHHNIYERVDFRGYPPAETLFAVSLWTVKVAVYGNERVYVVGAERALEVTRP